MGYLPLDKQEILFISSNQSEFNFPNNTIDEVTVWFDDCYEESSWVNHLVFMKGKIGILSILELNYSNFKLLANAMIDDDKLLNISKEQHFEYAKDLANTFVERTEFPVFLGENTSPFNNAHEIATFFPYRTSKEIVLAFQRGFANIPFPYLPRKKN